MKSYGLQLLLILLVFNQWERSDCTCSIDRDQVAICNDLQDVANIDTKDLRVLSAPTSLKILKPENLRDSNSLTNLNLSNGSLERIDSGSFVHLKQLITLDLADNRIRDIEPGAFDGLKNLRVLNLVNNQIRQLPSTLMNLEKLRKLNVTGNPLYCNCATLKLRDVLTSRGVKFVNEPTCHEQFGANEVPILKPNTKLVCEFEEQDTDMQADQALSEEEHGSGEITEENTTTVTSEDYELHNSDELIEPVTMKTVEVETSSPETTSFESTSDFDHSTTGSDVSSAVEISAASTSGELIYVDTEDPEKMEGSAWGTPDATEIKPSSEMPDIAVTGSSDEVDEEGSGFGSGFGKVPPIVYPPETPASSDVDTEATTRSPQATTSGGWFSFITNTLTEGISGLLGSGEKETVSSVNEEQSINHSTSDSTTSKDEEDETSEETETSGDLFGPVSVGISESSTPTDHHKLDGRIGESGTDDEQAAVAPTKEPKKGMGSYVVLAALLAILGGLIGFAAYKGDICRRKRKRRDVETGTELKDMQKSLLENATQAKVQPTNGCVMENVPLMNNTSTKLEPDTEHLTKGYHDDASAITNDSKFAHDLNDPKKPPRRSLNHETIERIPSNGISVGKTYPVDIVNASSRTSTPELPVQMNGQSADVPPASPNAHRVKITLQENPDSVPKTPILITRLRSGENLVKTPQ